uniref:Putative secreted protein n=1 Tax=Panstrongylus lignarius TaxID=156445 RepID=A0A224XXW7_9HEMI
MKSFIILFSALVLAQGLTETEVINEKDVEEFLNKYFELKKLAEEVKQFQETQKISSLQFATRMARLPPQCLPIETQFVEASDSDACNNLTVSLGKVWDLAIDINNWAFDVGAKVCGKFFGLIHCANINPATALKCFINDVKELKRIIDLYKPDVMKYENKIVALGKELKVEFHKCFKVHGKTQALAEQMIVEAQLCNETRNH